jgi:hypothetical protein
MFLKQATDKLRELFDTLFRMHDPINRADPLDGTKPIISGTDPARLAVGQPLGLTVTGQGFDQHCTALVNGAARQVNWQSPTRLTLTLLPEDVSRQAELTLTIRNPGETGGESETFRVVVE